MLPWPAETLNKHIIYQTTNNINGKVYIGKHLVSRLNDRYLGSGLSLKLAIDKHGVDNFTRSVISIHDTSIEAEQEELRLVNEEFIKQRHVYNRVIGGGLIVNNEETIKRSTAKRLITTETRGYNRVTPIISVEGVIYSQWCTVQSMYGLSHRRVARNLGNPELIDWFHLDDNKQHQLEQDFIRVQQGQRENRENSAKRMSQLGKRIRTPEERAQISERQKGRTVDPEVVNRVNKDPDKISKTAEKHRGMKRSDEAKHKMSAAKKGKQSNTKGCIWCHNPDTKQKILIKEIQQLPEGFIVGYGTRDKR